MLVITDSYKEQLITYPNFKHFNESSIEYLEELDFVNGLEFLSKVTSEYNLINTCIPDYSSLSDMFIEINILTMIINIPTKTINYINTKCTSSDFIIIPIRINFPNTKYIYNINPETYSENIVSSSGHANCFIIDNKLSTIEYFEPHGITISSPISIINYISQTINRLKYNIPFIKNYTFINSANICIIGVQKKHNTKYKKGYCLAWVLFFILLRLYNPSLTLDFLHDYITSRFSVDNLHSIISKFITFLMNLIKTPIPESNNTMAFIDTNNDAIYNRIQYLIDIYLQKLQYNSFDNCNSIIAELFSYKNNKYFHQIFKIALLKHQMSML